MCYVVTCTTGYCDVVTRQRCRLRPEVLPEEYMAARVADSRVVYGAPPQRLSWAGLRQNAVEEKPVPDEPLGTQEREWCYRLRVATRFLGLVRT